MNKCENSSLPYIILQQDNNFVYVLKRKNYSSRKIRQDLEKLKKINNLKLKIISNNIGFLDPNWEEKLLDNGISEYDKEMVILYDAYCHSNIFKFSTKEFICKKRGRQYTTNELILELENYMKKNDYKYYYCSNREIGINDLLKNKYKYLKNSQHLRFLYKYVKSKFPGLMSKLAFYPIKKINTIIAKFNLNKKFKNIKYIERNKNEIKFGTVYFEIMKNNNKFFLKGYDYFKTSKKEYNAYKLLKDYNIGVDIKYSDKKNYNIYEFYKGQTLGEYLKENCLSSENLKIFIDKMTDILKILIDEQIIHRDIREDNILLIFTGERLTNVKLIDFGYCIIDKNEYLSSKNIFSKKVLKSLGWLYKPDMYKWDDVVSFINMVENIYPNIYETKYLNKIEKMKGMLVIENEKNYKENSFFDFTL